MLAKYHMIVDFARPQKSNTVIVAENDVDSRQCFFRLLFDKAPFDMTGVVQATVMGVKGDQSYVYSPAEILVDEEGNPINELSWIIPGDITEDAGTVTLTITLADNVGAAISSFEFFVKVRNALYNEDDFIDDDDRQGFRDLLARCQAALERMEQMVEHDALPNPYPLKFTVDSVEYEYTGSEIVEIGMGDVAYLGEETGEVEITEDDSAAAIAVAAAESAQESATSASESLSAVETLAENLDSLIPTAIVTRDDVNKLTTVEVTDRHGTTVSTIYDGVSPVVSAEASVDGNTGTPSVTVTNTGTDSAPHYEFAFSNLKGAKGDPGSGVSIVDNLNSTSASDALSANMGHTLKGMVDTTASGAEEELRDTVGWTGKNLWSDELTTPEGKQSGVTYTVDATGYTITTGTTSQSGIFWGQNYLRNYFTLKGFSGISGIISFDYKGDSSYEGQVGALANVTVTTSWQHYEKTFSDLSEITAIAFYARNQSVSHTLEIKNLMLRKADIADSTYEPYHASVKQVLRDSEVIEGKNLLDSRTLNGTSDSLLYTPMLVGNGSFTLSSNVSLNSGNSANLFLLAGNVSTGASTDSNGVYVNHPITQTSQNGYVTVASRGLYSVDIRQYNNQLEEGTSATSYEPYYIPLKDSKFDRSEQAVLGAKNRLPYPFRNTTKTVSGITFTDNGDGSITINGTSTADADFALWGAWGSLSYLLSSGRYTLTFGVGESSALTCFAVYNSTTIATGYPDISAINAPNGISNILLRVPANKTLSNLKVYPMLRLASDPDDTYAPYAKTNKELTDEQDGYTGNKSPVNGVVTFSNLNSKYGYKLCVDIPDEASSTWPTSLSDLSIPKWSNVQRSTNSDGTINLAYTVTDADAQYCLRILK